MKRSEVYPMPQFFDRYIQMVEDIEVVKSLEDGLQLKSEEISSFHALGDKVYSQGKWTIKGIFQHVIDTERIQAYRAMRFARKDKNILPGFDEVLFGNHAQAERRTLDDLLLEYHLLRQSTILLFKSFNDEMLQEIGICFNISISPLALGFVIAGHQMHHMNIIRERYFPLLNEGS